MVNAKTLGFQITPDKAREMADTGLTPSPPAAQFGY